MLNTNTNTNTNDGLLWNGDHDPIKKLNELDENYKNSNNIIENRKQYLDVLLFSTWLKTCGMPVDIKESQLKKWIHKISLPEIFDYNEQYKEYLLDNKLISQDENQMLLFSDNENIVFVSKELGSNNLTSGIDSVYDLAVLDFNIVPWVELFPQLNFVSVQGYIEILSQRIFSYIEEFNSMRAYLKMLSVTMRQSSKFTAWYAQTTDSYNALQALGESLIELLISSDQLSGIVFNRQRYNLFNKYGVIELDKNINEIINSTDVAKTNWYKCYQELESKKLIVPWGSMLTIDKIENKKIGSEIKRSALSSSMIEPNGKHPINFSNGDCKSSGYKYIEIALGTQMFLLEKQSKSNVISTLFMPIISEDARLVQNTYGQKSGIRGIYFPTCYNGVRLFDQNKSDSLFISLENYGNNNEPLYYIINEKFVENVMSSSESLTLKFNPYFIAPFGRYTAKVSLEELSKSKVDKRINLLYSNTDSFSALSTKILDLIYPGIS